MIRPHRYRLSNAQAKNVWQQGRSIDVAIPLPDRDVDDPLAYATEMMDVAPQYVVSAEEAEISVAVGIKGVGLARVLGAITTDPTVWSLQVAVLIVTIAPPNPHSHYDGLRWPGYALLPDGSVIGGASE